MKQIATLSIWTDDSPGKESSYTVHARGSSNFRIVLRSHADKADPAIVLAHELGHMVGDIFGNPAQKRGGWFETTPEEQLASEKSAWHFAEEINPEIKNQPELVNSVLAHYQKIVDNAPGVPMGILRAIGLVT